MIGWHHINSKNPFSMPSKMSTQVTVLKIWSIILVCFHILAFGGISIAAIQSQTYGAIAFVIYTIFAILILKIRYNALASVRFNLTVAKLESILWNVYRMYSCGSNLYFSSRHYSFHFVGK